ncbi:PREDICTED: protein inturned [Wasmannia auropunctata]|uniref:protein inturned n=1 Tax=Wasmannia auropunctata TaxID=64793 RepID=UPI0005ED94AA|nr:PREDICTED: protein inturned [Wasmannia auropunctata]XP_011694665.1 PREDICTED: protein inturned [Wasmannia auropunctata]
MSEPESKSALLKSKCKSSDRPYSADICNEDDHDWWASDSDSSTGSYYSQSDTGSSVVEWESEIGPNGEVFYIESAEESLLENPTASEDKSESPQPELTRRRSTRAGKLFRLIRRKESKRWSTRNKRISSSVAASNTAAQEKGDGSKEVKFQDFQAGEIREVTLWVDPERRHKLGRRATLCEAYFGITPGAFSDEVRVMVAGFIPDGEAMKNRNIKIGDWLRSINSNNVTFQNLDRILSEITTPSNVTLELQRVAGVDVTAKLPKANEPKQSILVQYLLSKETSSSFMESLLNYPLGVIYLKTADLSEMGQELQGVLYTYPRFETKSAHSSLCTARGAFITLNHLLPSIVGSEPLSTTVHIGEEEMHIAYTSRDDELLLIALPGKCCSPQEIVKITEDIVRTLEFTYQSLTKCFTSVENQSSLDHFFMLIMRRLMNIKDSCKDADVKTNSANPQNESAESLENYKFRSAFSVASSIQLPRDAQIQIDAALSEMEAMDYRDWNEDPMDCQRLYTILGSCIYHKCHLLGSHLPHDDLIDVHSFLRHNGLLNLVSQEQVKCLVLWKQIYPSSCNRGNVDGNDGDQLLIPNGKWFLLVIGYGHDLLAVLLESGGCTAKYNDAIGPDVFYVEEAQETLKHIQKIGVTVLASKWITSNTRPEVIPFEEHTTTKASSSITENLFGLIKSSDAQTVSSKQNVSSISKKPQELPSILKKRSEENPVISGSVYSLQTSEDSLSQGTGGVSEMSDEAMPILGRRAIREKINSTLRYSDDSDSDIDIYKSDSNVLTMDISNIRENLLNQAEYLIPQKLTAGDKNYLYHYVHLDMVEGILLTSIPIQNTPKDNKILVNFNKCVHVIHRLLHNTVRFKMLNQDIDKTVINRSLIAVKEHGVLFEWENTAFWVIGRLYTSPHPKELYVCHQDSAPQNLIEIAFQLHS